MVSLSRSAHGFFHPSPSARNDVVSHNKSSSWVQDDNDNEVWEKPIGLTTETPIEIASEDDDDDDDETDIRSTKVPQHSQQTVNNQVNTSDTAIQTPSDTVITKNSKALSNSNNDNKKEKSRVESIGPSSPGINPFAQFAFGLGKAESSYFQQSDGQIIIPHDSSPENKNASNPRSILSPMSTKIEQNQKDENNSALIVKLQQSNRKPTKPTTKSIIKSKRQKTSSSKPSSFVSIHDLPLEEKIKIQEKWHSFSDSNASVETQRFQILIAARLHTQSHEKTVRQAMCKLRAFFSKDNEEQQQLDSATTTSTVYSCDVTNTNGELCTETLSNANPEVISNIIPSVLFANVKSRQIIQAAKDVRSRFHGRVPETQHGLNSIMGIGPRLADLLSYVNRYSAFTEDLKEESNSY